MTAPGVPVPEPEPAARPVVAGIPQPVGAESADPEVAAEPQPATPAAVPLRRPAATTVPFRHVAAPAPRRPPRPEPAGGWTTRLRAFAGRVDVASSLPERARRAARTIGVGRVLCWQLAAVGLLASTHESRRVVAAVALAAIGVVAATTVRVHGRLLYEWLAQAIRFLLHRRSGPIDPGSDRLVGAVKRHTSVETVELDEIPVAFIYQPAGVTAVLEPRIGGDEGVLRELTSAALLPPPDAESPPFTAQVVLQLAPAAEFESAAGDAGGRTWITLQAVRTAAIHRDAELGAALANAVRRLVRRLARDDLPARTLDRDEVLSVVAALTQVGEPGGADETTTTVRETWSAWQVGSTSQACFRIENWQQADPVTRAVILRRLQLVPSLGTTVAITARRGVRSEQAQATVRVTDTTRLRLENCADLIAFAMENVGAGVRLRRLYGDQQAAVAASLPFGGVS